MTNRINSILELSLFIGIHVDAKLQEELVKCNPHLHALFTNGNEYLQYHEQGQKRYLGKNVSNSLTLNELDLNEQHVLSLVRRLVPSLKKTELVIFGLSHG